MTQEKTRDIINSITDKNSLKAVQVAFNINEMQDVTIDKLIKLVASMDQNMKLLATKVLELEQKLNVANKGIERIDEQRKN